MNICQNIRDHIEKKKLKNGDTLSSSFFCLCKNIISNANSIHESILYTLHYIDDGLLQSTVPP